MDKISVAPARRIESVGQSASTTALVEGGLRAMFPVKRKILLVLLLMVDLILGGAGLRARQPSDKSRPAKAVAVLSAKPLFSPNGKWMALVDYDLKRSISRGGTCGFAHTLRLREPLGGKDRWTVEHAGPFGPIIFSPDSQTLAVARGDQVQLLEAATGKERRSLTVKQQPIPTYPGMEEKQERRAQVVVDLAIAPDGKTLVTVSHEVLVVFSCTVSFKSSD